MPKRPLKQVADDPEADAEAAGCATAEELMQRAMDARLGEVTDKWWYRSRDGVAELVRYRVEGDDGDVVLQAAMMAVGWAAGWSDTKAPLYRVYEGLGKSPVFVVQGESAVEAALGMGLSAVTSAGDAQDVGRSNWRPLAGRRVGIIPTNSQAGRAYARAVAGELLALDPPPEVRMVELPYVEEDDDILSFDCAQPGQSPAQRVLALAARAPLMTRADLQGRPVIHPLADVSPAQVRWLWPGRVPIGKPTVIFGDPGQGKSLLALDLAARVSAGSDWPDGRGRAPRGKVLLMCRDDDLRDTIRPRLDQAGADVPNIIALDSVMRVVAGREVQRGITLDDVADLERAIVLAGNVRLVVIDPLSAYFVPGAGGPRRIGRGIRTAIAALADIADRHALAVIMTSQLGSRGRGPSGYGTAGGISLMAAVRSAWVLAPDPEQRHRRLLLPVKINVGDSGGGLACRVAQDAVAWEAAPIAAGVFPAPPRRGPKPQSREAAAQWLQGQLAGGPVLVGAAGDAGTLRDAADTGGMAWATVQRAFRDIHGVSERCPNTGKYSWRLPAPQADSTPPAQPAVNTGDDKNNLIT